MASSSLQNILIIGSNSIVSEQLVMQLSGKYSIDIVYSSEKCGVSNDRFDGEAIPLVRLFSLEKTYDYVIIVSAFVPQKGESSITRLFEINVDLVERITLKFRDSKIIYCSTVSVYSPSKNEISEITLTNPVNEYGLSKLWGERIVQRNSVSYSIIRISSIIGPGMKVKTFLPRIVVDALENKKITLTGDGSRLQNYIDVADLCKLIERSLNYQKNAVFLAVGSKSYTNKQIAEIIAKNIPLQLLYEGVDESASYEYDASFTNEVLNFAHIISIEESIEKIIEWKRKKY
ncbi:MAG: hypothetical protein K0S44_2493 [Bacteroidetes bacterium]|jgi:nucleoside-diphosphate-sugar epimerase|nr:hypothetical protein [Bacteroidota bacterium]